MDLDIMLSTITSKKPQPFTGSMSL